MRTPDELLCELWAVLDDVMDVEPDTTVTIDAIRREVKPVTVWVGSDALTGETCIGNGRTIHEALSDALAAAEHTRRQQDV